MATLNPLLLVLLCSFGCTTSQQFPPPHHSYTPHFNRVAAFLILILVPVLLLFAFFSAYFCHYSSYNRSSIAPSNTYVDFSSRRGLRPGLDPSVIETFPILSYSAARAMGKETQTLECAVCLSEFEEEDNMRMLPRCCHVFHPECIDEWFVKNVTCPVCRADLEKISDEVKINVEDVKLPSDRFTLQMTEEVRREIEAAVVMKRSMSMAARFVFGEERSERRGYRSRRQWRSDPWGSAGLSGKKEAEGSRKGLSDGGGKLDADAGDQDGEPST